MTSSACLPPEGSAFIDFRPRGPDLVENFHLYATLAIIAGTIFLYALDRIPVESISLGAITLLLVLFGTFPFTPEGGETVTVDALLSGFASPALITVLALLIVGKGLFATDALEGVTNRIGRIYGGNPRLSIAIILVVAGVTSAFLNNTPVVVIFIRKEILVRSWIFPKILPSRIIFYYIEF